MMRTSRTSGSRPFLPKTEEYIRQRDGGLCVYCGKPGSLIDHVVPYRYGGPSTSANGVFCCRRCNQLKGGDRWVDYVERAFVYLATKGEDLSWVDRYDPPRAPARPRHAPEESETGEWA